MQAFFQNIPSDFSGQKNEPFMCGGGIYSRREAERLTDQYIQRYGRRLYGLCRSLCPSPHDADDLYQETWLRAIKHFSKYDPSREFEPWLTKICVNTYRSSLRRLTRSLLLDFPTSGEKDRLLDSLPAPEERDYLPLYEAVDHLPDKLRLAVVLFYFQGQDLAATVEILNVPVGTVKSRLNKARKQLKEALSDEPGLRL